MGTNSADAVRSYKPHREEFDETLRLSNCTPGEAVHIEEMGARSMGIRPVLLLRGRIQQHDGVDAVNGLTQVLELVFNNSNVSVK